MNTKLIDTDCPPMFGCLEGAGMENGRWFIHLMTRNGYLEFVSTDPKSAASVELASNILNGQSGLMNPNIYVEIKDGCLLCFQKTIIDSQIQKESTRRGESIFREKGVIAKDIFTIINNNELHYGTKYYCVHNAIGIWTELDGKFEGGVEKKGCPYWSENALKVVREIKDRSQIKKLLRHEHIVPRIVLIDRILGIPPHGKNITCWTAQEIEDFLNRFCIGAIVTKDDDDKKLNLLHKKCMPENWNWDTPSPDPWARYRLSEVVVYNPEHVIWRDGKVNVESVGNPVP